MFSLSLTLKTHDFAPDQHSFLGVVRKLAIALMTTVAVMTITKSMTFSV